MPIQKFRLAWIAGSIVLVMLVVAAPVLKADQYSALASAIQALAVVPAITAAALSLLADSHDRRVDRVLEFHQQLTSGELQAARLRLVGHLRRHGSSGKARQATRDELRADPVLSRYTSDANKIRPIDDINLMLRFFERVNAARIAGSVNLPLLVELVGRHAGWLDQAIGQEDQVPRAPLHDLATWANEFAVANQGKYPYLSNWGSNRAEDFAESTG